MNDMLDLFIAGGGAAGLTAAVYAMRSGLDFILADISSSMGSQIALTDEVDNYTGFDSVNGFELIKKFYEHAKSLGAPMVNDEVSLIEKENKSFKIKCANNEYRAKTVIYCAGATHRELGVKGEKEFSGHGVGYCAVCDGFFYRNKTVIVVGGGNTAVTDALYLSKICKRVIVVHRRDKFRADKGRVQKLINTENTEIIYSAELDEIIGDKTVKAVLLKDGRKIDADGVFIAVGVSPRSGAVKNIVKTDEAGYIIAGEDCQTSTAGLFAAGDVRTKALRQIITACADGANSVCGVTAYLESQDS